MQSNGSIANTMVDGSENYSAGPKAKGKCKIGANAILHLILFRSVC